MSYKVIDLQSGATLRDCLTFDAAYEVVADSRQFPHAWKDIVESDQDTPPMMRDNQDSHTART